jgi:hypothetical protein
MTQRSFQLVVRTMSVMIIGIAVLTTTGQATPVAARLGCNSVYCEGGTVCPGESFLEDWCTVSAGCPSSTPGCAENFGICDPGLAIRCNTFEQ